MQDTARHRNMLQHITEHCNMLQHTTKHCNMLQHTTEHSNIPRPFHGRQQQLQSCWGENCMTLRRTATHWDALQHTATHLALFTVVRNSFSDVEERPVLIGVLRVAVRQLFASLHLALREYSFIRAPWLVHTCNMTHLHVRAMCAMTHLHVQYDSFTWLVWLIYNMTHLHVHLQCDSFTCHDSFTFTCIVWLFHIFSMTHLHAMTHLRVQYRTHKSNIIK